MAIYAYTDIDLSDISVTVTSVYLVEPTTYVSADYRFGTLTPGFWNVTHTRLSETAVQTPDPNSGSVTVPVPPGLTWLRDSEHWEVSGNQTLVSGATDPHAAAWFSAHNPGLIPTTLFTPSTATLAADPEPGFGYVASDSISGGLHTVTSGSVTNTTGPDPFLYAVPTSGSGTADVTWLNDDNAGGVIPPGPGTYAFDQTAFISYSEPAAGWFGYTLIIFGDTPPPDPPDPYTVTLSITITLTNQRVRLRSCISGCSGGTGGGGGGGGFDTHLGAVEVGGERNWVHFCQNQYLSVSSITDLSTFDFVSSGPDVHGVGGGSFVRTVSQFSLSWDVRRALLFIVSLTVGDIPSGDVPIGGALYRSADGRTLVPLDTPYVGVEDELLVRTATARALGEVEGEKGLWVALWQDDGSLDAGLTDNITFQTSDDGGETWADEIGCIDDTDTQLNGKLMSLDWDVRRASLLLALSNVLYTSTDDGATWTAVAFAASATSWILAGVAGQTGVWSVFLQNDGSIDPLLEGDITMSLSTDGGDTWSDAVNCMDDEGTKVGGTLYSLAWSVRWGCFILSLAGATYTSNDYGATCTLVTENIPV